MKVSKHFESLLTDRTREEQMCLKAGFYNGYESAKDRITQLEAELAEARKDQARYKYMRKLNVPQFHKIFILNLSSDIRFDECIDAAIKEQGK